MGDFLYLYGMEVFHYVYHLIDPVTGQFYYGSRTCKGITPQEDKYMGSMCAWKPEDKSRLKKTILKEFPTRKEATLYEIELIKLYVKDDLNENYHIPTVGFSTLGLPGPNKKNSDIFIKESMEVHGDLYDYSKVNYVDNNTHVNIVCSKHGVFPQSPYKHVKEGHKCPKCSGVRDTEMFIEKAKSIHGDKYDYSKVLYVDAITEVIIVCPTHGDFKQRPTNHINVKNGCDKCRLTFKDTTETFIDKSKKIYGDTYDYSKVEYINSKTDVIIICPQHGEFIKTPDNHLNDNQGCTQCGILEGRKKQKESLKNSGKVKGGNNPAARKVMNIKTKQVYGCASEVAEILGISANNLRKKLRGDNKNNTDYVYYDGV
jgi:hypothetical protein